MENMQNWYSIRGYTRDFLQLVYRYYAECGVSYVCTYYNLDIPDSILDTEVLDGGAYELTGEWSGHKWNKILFLPVYNTETIANPFTADERGFGKFDTVTSFNFPSLVGIKPHVHDFVVFEETVLNDETDKYGLAVDENKPNPKVPLYQIVNFEKATNTKVTFWKVNLKVSFKEQLDLDNQLNNTYVFLDLEKKIYPLDKSYFLLNLLQKNRSLTGNKYFKENIGFYFNNF